MQNNQNFNHFSMYEPNGSSSKAKEFALDNKFLLSNIAKDEIHVLLVDHDRKCLVSTAKLLDLYSYKVTRVEQASTALMMLLDGQKFDLVMATVHSPELLALKLLKEAVSKEMLVILMSNFEDPFMARKAIENGAFLFVEKPVSMELLKHLWQYVVRERKQKDEKKERKEESGNNENNAKEKIEGKNEVKISCPEAEVGEIAPLSYTASIGKRIWTTELHSKFLDAVKRLGEGRCFPADIVAVMNVPGLTRMQVASHLQKCRRNTWRDPRERKRRSIAPQSASTADEDREKTDSEKRFGSMPYGESSSTP